MTVPDTGRGPLSTVVRGGGPGLLLAHGGGGGTVDFAPFIGPLSRRFTVVLPHYPGVGATPRQTEPLDLDDLADRLVATAADAGVHTFSVVAYSLGCPVSVRLAVRYPERVRSLVLMAGFARPDSRLRLLVGVWRALAALGDRDLLARFVTALITGEDRLNAQSRDAVRARTEELARALPEALDDHLDLVERVDVRDDLAKVDVPTLVVAARADQLATPRHSREIAAGIPGARYVEVPGGHNLAEESADEVLGVLDGFLRPVSGRDDSRLPDTGAD
ncbi:alpha/beta hydrolase [Thermobifida halotolerans]|uniref:Alpha/beta hydrolase n=1 Tax=Thermobifida halotolerans TaxID=483545 RepID=A0AA97LVG3_9ACTN|nr:alpha/beta hydrolase [Thermobifida halotolerans]UOE18651.1 alpha/beta hydrolase [Thermobifida halotolerans]